MHTKIHMIYTYSCWRLQYRAWTSSLLLLYRCALILWLVTFKRQLFRWVTAIWLFPFEGHTLWANIHGHWATDVSPAQNSARLQINKLRILSFLVYQFMRKVAKSLKNGPFYSVVCINSNSPMISYVENIKVLNKSIVLSLHLLPIACNRNLQLLRLP